MNKKDLGTYYTKVKAEFDEKLGLVEQLKQDVEAIKAGANTDVAAIETLKTNAQTILTEIEASATKLKTELEKLETLREQANDPEEGLEITIEEIEKLKTQANELKNDIKGFRDTSQENNSEIENFQSTSSKIVTKLSKLEKDAETSLSQIEKYYKLATDTGLAGSFDQRKQELSKSVNKWYWSMVASTGVLTAILIAVLFITLKDKLDLSYAFSFRVVFISPIIFFVFFSAYQYSKERDLLERYAFKAVTAIALESYTELLSFRFNEKDHETQILNFVLSAMNTIYREPHGSDDKVGTTLGFRVGNKLGGIESTLSQINEKLSDQAAAAKKA